jgi:hypothetical protein
VEKNFSAFPIFFLRFGNLKFFGEMISDVVKVNLDGLAKSPSAALRFNPALLDKDLGLLTQR